MRNSRRKPLVVQTTIPGVFQAIGAASGTFIVTSMNNYTQDLLVYRVTAIWNDSESDATLLSTRIVSLSRNQAAPDPQELDVSYTTSVSAPDFDGVHIVFDPQTPYYIPSDRLLAIVTANRVTALLPWSLAYRVEFDYAHAEPDVPPDRLYQGV